jgi:hypothetical protein
MTWSTRVVWAALAAAALGGCATSDALFGTSGVGAGGGGGEGGAGGGPGGGVLAPTDRVDLLIVVDNSRTMGDKQSILALGVDALLAALTSPRCIDADGVPSSVTPTSPDAPCPPGTARELPPVRDLHVGVVSSSLGGHGADVCGNTVSTTENDRAHLLSRMSAADPDGTKVKTYEDLGFLAWDPDGTLSPPGESDAALFATRLRAILDGVGELGCGFEASLESWYRFLVDPDPFVETKVVNKEALLEGTDDELLAQRAAFLRPDSALVVVMLTDENDCSIRDGGQYFFVAMFDGGNFHLPRPRAACAQDPASACCRSCGQPPAGGCDPSQDDCCIDAECKKLKYLEPAEDPIDLRCFDQKRRFGIDFLQPIDRYVKGLTSASVEDRHGNVRPNPIFAGGGRKPGHVRLVGILGVPWQDVARRALSGVPDLFEGRSAAGHPVGGLQGPAERAAYATWDLVVGDYPTFTPPKDPLMVSSVAPRSGVHPVLNLKLAPPSAGYYSNPINGHEYDPPVKNDLQFACLFPLPSPKDCNANPEGCRCGGTIGSDPSCQAPDGSYSSLQRSAPAYPSTRQLALLQALEPLGVVGSVCPAQLDDPGTRDWGYRPVFDALAESLRGVLK